MNTQHALTPFAKLSQELLAALSQWDDTDADTLAVSKERVAALSPNASASLTAFVHHHIRRCSVCTCISVVSFVLIYVVLFACSPHGSRNPLPAPVDAALIVLASISVISPIAGNWIISGRVFRNAVTALAATYPVLAVGVLADGTFWLTQSKKQMRGLSDTPLTVALQNLLARDTFPPVPLSDKQRRKLWRHVGAKSSELNVALMRVFIKMEDGFGLPRVRRIAEHSRIWEVREAAQEYIAHFAPQEVEPQNAQGFISSSRVGEITAGEDTILRRVMELGSRNAVERQAAQTALHTMNKTQLEQILRMVGQEPEGSRRVSRAVSYGCIFTGMALGSTRYIPCIRSPYYDMRMALIVAFGCAVGGGAIGWLVGANINYSRRNRQRARMLGCEGGVFPAKRLLETLGALENTALLDTLIVHLPSENSLDPDQLSVRKTLQQTIVRLLPRLGANDASLLGDAARNLLNRQLGRNKLALTDSWAGQGRAERNAAYDEAILKAWEQVGDERALPFVEKLAAQAALFPAQRRIEQAARECLPYLQSRADHQRTAQTLLRAAQSPVEPGDILLRAATAQAAPVDAEQLLRAGQQ